LQGDELVALRRVCNWVPKELRIGFEVQLNCALRDHE
jgi:hypothetical protein